MQRTIEMAVICAALALTAGCVVDRYGRVVIAPPPPPPPVIIARPPPTLFEKAERGDAVAQFTLGSSYANGWGVAQNYREAVSWYYLSAKQGYAPAQNRLGVCYYRGLGTPRNYAAAVAWYRRAAEQGNAAAEDNLGICYYSGRGVVRDFAEAAKWYRLSAAQGNQAAATHLRQIPGPAITTVAAAPIANRQIVQTPPPTPPSRATEPEEASGNQMTVDEIKELSSAGVKADILTGQIRSTHSKFTSQDIAAAQQANIDPSVIACMRENAR